MIRRPARNYAAARAAFFDLDGTLLPPPSLELRFVHLLRRRGALRTEHFLRWLGEAVQLAPRGLLAMRHSNKIYLRGLAEIDRDAPLLSVERIVPAFLPDALERLQWHAEQGHRIVILSGTLEFLADYAALAVEAQLAARGCAPSLRVCATRLEVSDGRWTGRVLGEPLAGEAKARAVAHLAEIEGLALEQCFAYADRASDRWLLAAVGHPFAVNPSWRLTRLARANGWPILQWREKKEPRRLTGKAVGQFIPQQKTRIAKQESDV